MTTWKKGLALAGLAAAFAAAPAWAQKSGGTLRMYFADNPPSTSIHEEATTSTVVPFMGLYNNLVVFDPQVPQNSACGSLSDPQTAHLTMSAQCTGR